MTKETDALDDVIARQSEQLSKLTALVEKLTGVTEILAMRVDSARSALAITLSATALIAVESIPDGGARKTILEAIQKAANLYAEGIAEDAE